MAYFKKCMMMLALAISSATAGEIDGLVNKLVEKGTLTGIEGREILTAAQEEQKSQISKGTHPVLPKWLQTFKMKGDFRFRYQYEEKDGSVERERERLRIRLGVESKVADSIKIVTGLATGATDPRSTNQTMENNFEPKNINFDYAFADVTLHEWVNLNLGKMKNPLWSAGDLLWDTDINPEGLAIMASIPAMDSMKVFLNTSYFVLDEVSTSKDDPYMYAFQPGIDWNITEQINLKAALTGYFYDNVKGAMMEKTAGTNSGISKDKTSGAFKGGYAYDYDSYAFDIEFGVNEICDPLPYAGIFGEYLENFDPSDDNRGYLAGLKLGAKNVKDQGQWQLSGAYRKLEKDACLDIFPDSDFYGGKTNVKGYELILAYGLFTNTQLNLDYYKTENLSGTIVKEDLYQFDLNFKF